MNSYQILHFDNNRMLNWSFSKLKTYSPSKWFISICQTLKRNGNRLTDLAFVLDSL